MHVLFIFWRMKYLSYHFNWKLPNNILLIYIPFTVDFFQNITWLQWHWLKQLTLQVPGLTVICNDNCSSRSYSCVQFSLRLVWKLNLPTLTNSCHSAPSLCMTVSNISSRVEHLAYGDDATYTIFLYKSMIKLFIIKTTPHLSIEA
jgi:hypothetical protein